MGAALCVLQDVLDDNSELHSSLGEWESVDDFKTGPFPIVTGG